MALNRRESSDDMPGVLPPDPQDISVKKKSGISRALRRTRIGMIWERVARSFWPLATILALIFASFAFGGVTAVPALVLPWLASGVGLLLIIAAIWGGMRFQRVKPAEVIQRLDHSLPGRPLAALGDKAAIGGEGTLWQAHLAQMEERAAQARAVAPNAELSKRDPYALRLVAMVALAMALIFGSFSQFGNGVSAIAATVNRPFGNDNQTSSAPTWEGWAEPPAYTHRPTIYLNAWKEGEPLELPKGSVVTFRLYGEGSKITQTIGAMQGNDPLAPEFKAETSGVIEVSERRFEVTVLPDHSPTIHAAGEATRRADGKMVQGFEASDDHGVTSAKAEITLNIAEVPRQYGLVIEPEPRKPLSFDLPIPTSGKRQDIRGQLVQDLSRHPWANLPVTLILRASDGIEQQGTSKPVNIELPGRRFFDPLAAALIEIRRDLLWSRDNAERSAEILRAVTWQPEGFVEDTLYRELRGSVGLMEGDSFTPEQRDKLAEALWQAAVLLEDGGLSDALARMKQAQEKLSEAIRKGASQDEIQQLMDELKEATDAYTQMLAEQGKQDPSERFAKNQEKQTITGDQIQEMMDEIQRLMNEGRMAEAQQLLEQFNRMMENLQVTQGQAGEGQQQGGKGNQPMNRLADTLREQQKLSDEAFREMQEQFGEGNIGETPESSDELAKRQRELREELGQQRGLLEGEAGENGDQAQQRLDEAGRAMEDAEEALRNGDLGGALQRQADAIQSMREGMRALGDGLRDRQRAADDNNETTPPEGPEGESGDSAAQQGQSGERSPATDPLGREQAGSGNSAASGELAENGIDPAARARDLLDEIRRRSGERQRPEEELNYLERLLERF